MAENCNHQCEGCELSGNCESERKSFLIDTNDFSQIKKIYAVMSGKGGVGKSMVTSLLASHLSKKGYKVAILDADITGPSIPRSFGITTKAKGNEYGIFPEQTKTGIKVMSVNLLLENDTDPVVWRGPVISGTVQQFYKEVIWGDIDFMFVDMPPGTGDVPLTIYQSLPVDGIIVVTSPQELVSMIVNKAVKMANMMKKDVVGVVENLSYFHCEDNGKDYKIFGESHLDEVAKTNNITNIAKLPISPYLASLQDTGSIEDAELKELDPIVSFIEKSLNN